MAIDGTRRPFRFGVQATLPSLVAWQEFARKLEDLGYATLVVDDHFDRQLAPFPALMAAAAVTSRLRLGPLVLNNDLRHPAVMAREAASVDLLTNGRLELGLGAGWIAADYTTSGIPFDAPGVRLGRLMETVAIVKAFFRGDPITFRGKYFQIDGLEPTPRPAQSPRPPIVIGGRQERMLKFAACEADVVSISNLRPRGPQARPPASITQKVDWIRSAAGSRYERIELSTNAWDVRVTEQPAEALAELSARRGVPTDVLLESPGTLVGSSAAIQEQLLRWRQTHDLSYFVVGLDAVDAFAPVVARLGGT